MSRHIIPGRIAGILADNQRLALMARIGYAARGVVFLVIGGFALLAALGSGRPQSMRGALQSLLGNAAGGVLLWIVAAGLVFFAGRPLLETSFDADWFGSSPYGLRVLLPVLPLVGASAAIVNRTDEHLSLGQPAQRNPLLDNGLKWFLYRAVGRYPPLQSNIAISAYEILPFKVAALVHA